MNRNVLEPESNTWSGAEVAGPENWQEAIELLAPAPKVFEGEELQLDEVARYISAQYIAGTQGDEVPTILQDPSLSEAVDPVLRNIGEIKGLGEGWEARHRKVQVALRPELDGVFDFSTNKMRKYFGDPAEGYRQLLAKIAIGQITSHSWSKDAKCKDMEPDQFHIELDGVQLDKEEREVFKQELIDLTEICRSCPVRQECLAHGLASTDKVNGIRIYGGMLIQQVRQKVYLKATDPFDY